MERQHQPCQPTPGQPPHRLTGASIVRSESRDRRIELLRGLGRRSRPSLVARVAHVIDPVAEQQTFRALAGARLLDHRRETLGVGTERFSCSWVCRRGFRRRSSPRSPLDDEAPTRPVHAAHAQPCGFAPAQTRVRQRQHERRIRRARRQRRHLVMREVAAALRRFVRGDAAHLDLRSCRFDGQYRASFGHGSHAVNAADDICGQMEKNVVNGLSVEGRLPRRREFSDRSRLRFRLSLIADSALARSA